jgi:hypothetical protein
MNTRLKSETTWHSLVELTVLFLIFILLIVTVIYFLA